MPLQVLSPTRALYLEQISVKRATKINETLNDPHQRATIFSHKQMIEEEEALSASFVKIQKCRLYGCL